MHLATKLSNRVLRYDGVSLISPEMVTQALLLGAGPTEIRVTGDSWEIQQFNLNCDDGDELKKNNDEVKLDTSWSLPKEWASLTIDQVQHLIVDKATDLIAKAKYSEVQVAKAYTRIEQELKEIERRNMVDFLKTIMFVLETFKKNNICWGVGRGSSCASYILFILGLHVVDCIKFDVPMEEFFHD